MEPAVESPSTVEKEKIFNMTEEEIENRMHNKIRKTCSSKCHIEKRDGIICIMREKDMKELRCFNHCASKYYQVTDIIKQMLAKDQFK